MTTLLHIVVYLYISSRHNHSQYLITTETNLCHSIEIHSAFELYVVNAGLLVSGFLCLRLDYRMEACRVHASAIVHENKKHFAVWAPIFVSVEAMLGEPEERTTEQAHHRPRVHGTTPTASCFLAGQPGTYCCPGGRFHTDRRLSHQGALCC